jgi:hypothetical protein
MVFNLQTILNDIQSRLTKLKLLDHSQVCAVRSTVQKWCVLGSIFAFVVLVAFACLSLLETHEYTEKCFMGRKSKRRRQNSSVSSPHAKMSNTPPPSMSNLTYAVKNANETLYGPPHVIPPMFTNVSPTNSNMQMQLGPQMPCYLGIHFTKGRFTCSIY